MVIRAVIVWVHVLCAVLWVGACAVFVITAAALTGEPAESHALAIRTAPRINRVSVPLAILIPLTGLGNLFFAVRTHGLTLPAEFIVLLAAKVILLAVMIMASWSAWRTVAMLQEKSDGGATMSDGAELRRLTALYGITGIAGTIAMALGLWLSGV
jgi:putative copper export protein